MTILDNFKDLFKKDDGVIEVITYASSTYDFWDLIEAKKAVPKWWKDMAIKFDDVIPLTPNPIFEKFKRPISTVKQCPAIQDILSTGIIFKAWSDITILVSPDGVVESIIADEKIGPSGEGSNHPYIQRNGVFKNYAHYKLTPPIFLKTKTYRKFLWTGAFWHNPSLVENNIHIVPGIIDYKTQTGMNINMFLPLKNEPYQLNINFGDPLIHLIPLDNKPIKIIKKLTDINGFQHMSNTHLKFVGSPKILKSKMKN
jgi:hypothetical protein